MGQTDINGKTKREGWSECLLRSKVYGSKEENKENMIDHIYEKYVSIGLKNDRALISI
jgi:hypothetical protein